jgi:uncharacterized membrane protein
MEGLILLGLAILFFMLLGARNSVSSRLNDVMTRLDVISAKLSKLEQERSKKEGGTTHPAAAPTQPIPIPVTPESKPVGIPEKKPPVIKVPEPLPVIPGTNPVPVFTSKHGPRETIATPKTPGFFERNPDLEKFIGENLANKIGIGILVLGIGFFVKYAIDKEWIGVYGRVFIGLFCGAVLIALAHRLRKSFAAFSSVLVGGGIAILYLTITIAFHEYHILGQTAAFMVMVLITGFTILLSIAYDRIELAILAILGGFGSPFMVSTGEGNYVVLFTYILILDVGMLVLAYFKRWQAVNIIAYLFSILLFGSWLASRFDYGQPSMIAGALIFATLFYLVFFAMNIVNNLKERTKFEAAEFSILISNTFLYYSAGMFILNNTEGEIYRGLFTASIGIFNFIFAYLLFRSKRVDRNLVFLLIGLVLTFISLAAPVQLEGNYITLFWAAEAVLLLWLSQQSGITLMKIGSAVVMALMWISLAMDWINIYGYADDGHLNVMLNKGYITSFVALLSISGFYYLLRYEASDENRIIHRGRIILSIMGAVILYLWNYLELNHQLNVFVEPSAATVIIGSYNMLFTLFVFFVVGRFAPSVKTNIALASLGLITVVAYFARYHSDITVSRDLYLAGQSSFLGFGFHYLLVGLLIVIAAWTINKFRTMTGFNTSTFHLYSWFFVFFFIFLASAELDHTILLTMSNGSDDVLHLIAQNHKIGYPILWGVSSFILIAIGLRKKRRHLRIISLTLFLVTLLKLFLVDIRGISEGGKIAAFISLGIMLLVVSFMYQRLKQFLMVEEESTDTANNHEPV